MNKVTRLALVLIMLTSIGASAWQISRRPAPKAHLVCQPCHEQSDCPNGDPQCGSCNNTRCGPII